MARPKIHGEESVDDLLDAAAELLRRGGPDAVSVRAVADGSGRSSRAVYALFGSKQALIDALAERGYLALAERVDALPRGGNPAAELVQAGVVGFRSFALGDPQIFRLTFEQVSAEVLTQPRVGRAAYRAYEALRSRVEALRAAGGVHPDRDVPECVFAFHALCQGMAAGELAARPVPDGPGFWRSMQGSDFESVWTRALEALVGGFAYR
ncbi:MAG TPA: TetR/AcrR family transcriptional regulator [Nocardioidaceae bacterium]|nr:TetR/AcrR family transcriptional regulator [Nocardioidaceae bacterium]